MLVFAVALLVLSAGPAVAAATEWCSPAFRQGVRSFLEEQVGSKLKLSAGVLAVSLSGFD